MLGHKIIFASLSQLQKIMKIVAECITCIILQEYFLHSYPLNNTSTKVTLDVNSPGLRKKGEEAQRIFSLAFRKQEIHAALRNLETLPK